MFTPQFERFIAPARPKAQIWRLLASIGIIAACYFGATVGLFFLAAMLLGPQRAQALALSLAHPQTPQLVFALFASFPGAAIGAMLATRFIHGRRIRTLFGAGPQLLRGFLLALAVSAVFAAVYILIWSFLFSARPNLGLGLWLKLLPLTLLALLIQTGTEEVIFRGFLPQQLAARFSNPLIWFVLPSLAFGAMHYDPSLAMPVRWMVVAATTVFALAALDLVRVTGNLGAAWGFHFANNLLAVGLLGNSGSITGLALFVTPYSASDTALMPWLLLADMLTTIAIWATLRRLLHR